MKGRRILGTYVGVGLAAALSSGIHAIAISALFDVLVAGIVFVAVNQLIYGYPDDIRGTHPIVLLVLGVVGIVQDTLIWLLVSWLSGKMQAGFHVDGFLAALLGGVIVRATVLVLLALGPRPTERTP
ncbi:phage holin family protein [Streptomyces sp. NPDC101776]|uniref:phage holin family protein n=1 Tax=Streptomyces sp. NPDC101776 TaxID=3366146 RepID=UPI00382979D0